MKAVAGSYMTNEVEQKMNIQTVMKPQSGDSGRGSAKGGSGDDEEVVVPPINSTEPLDVTHEGMFKNVADYGIKYNSIINTNPAQIKSIVLSANKEGVSTADGLLQLNNIHAIAKAATLAPGNEIGYDEKGTAIQSKTGLLLQDKGFNVNSREKNTPYLNSNIAVKGDTKYSMNDYAALLQVPFDKLPSYLKISSAGYGVNSETVKAIESGKICFDDVDLKIYFQNKKIKDKNAPNGERNMTDAEINTAINELTGGDANQKGGTYGSMFDISVNLDSDGFVIDNDNDPSTPEVVTTSITVKDDYSGLINQYDSQLSKLTPNTPLYNSIKAKRDNLADKRDKTQYKIDMLNAYNIENPSDRELRLQEINTKYQDKYTSDLIENKAAFNEFAENVNRLRKGIEAKAIEAANYRGLQLATLVGLDVNVSAENIRY